MLKTRLTSFLSLALLLLHTHFSICNGVSALSLDSLKTSEIDAMLTRVCTKKVGECMEAEEMGMDSETNRRVLAVQKKYISYETLKKDLVPCERPGASYYNCRADGEANPYTRGCEVISRCARNIRDTNS
ncbi:hypothetical protein L1049_017229 [Liquidambar formosana]|uniref:Protein RALF-like 24 n=1 Tax=Liquidambar formosana TaxID=63359 RepID=A0AAP0S0S6_LIQFO